MYAQRAYAHESANEKTAVEHEADATEYLDFRNRLDSLAQASVATR